MTVHFSPKIVSQHIDTLKTSHKALDEDAFNKKFDAFCGILEDFKIQAQELKDETNFNNFVIAELRGFGKFKVFAQGSGVYRYQISNEDFFMKLGAVKFGADRPQILVEYRQDFLFTVGHVRAYELVKKFVFAVLGATKDNVTEIHLATDIWGVRYDYFDLQRFQTHFKRSEISKDIDLTNVQCIGRRNAETISFGKGAFMFRIYDKNIQLSSHPDKKALLYLKWIYNGYEVGSKAPVFRHEIQLRDDHLKQHIDPKTIDRVSFVFSILGSLWAYATEKVQYVDLSHDELQRCVTTTSLNTVKSIYQRAKEDEKRFHFWEYVKTWDNHFVAQSVKYRDYKETKASNALRACKMFVSSAYQNMWDNPEALQEAFKLAQRDTYNFKGLTLHQYGQKKIVDGFMQNETAIVKFGLVPPPSYQADQSNALSVYLKVVGSLPEIMKQTVFSQSVHDKMKQVALDSEARRVF
jgi:hypothetical protein